MSPLGVLGQNKKGHGVSPKEPSNHKILLVFVDVHRMKLHRHHESMSPLGVLGQTEGPDMSSKEPSHHKIMSGFFDFAKA